MGIEAGLDLLACPRCGSGLDLVAAGAGRALACASGHSFDVAKQGYVNLLGGPEPGNADTAAMLAARQRVHASGLFEPVAAEVATHLVGRPRVLEVGAGTAYYLARALGDDDAGVGIALDVSKAAARVAARADRRIAAVVADVWSALPVADHCLDAVLCVFAPRNLAEFARVLRPDGRLVVVTPRPEHLAGLRDRHGLLEVPAGKADQLAAAAAEFFEPVANSGLVRAADVDAALAADVIAMGPNAFHRVPDDVTAGSIVVAVNIQVFRPLAPTAA
ncbi:MAG: SAM-dependent methyltransferase [Actinobacteria bacterium HGW-Actinobacteria-5]|nr:MAG: SAM-dependent methyltransferase [Actinobacteria bacterium HGW-Actinobacteria-5]